MQTKNYPKISVITPSFNQADYIEETIKSVITQDYDNFEYIVIDGGSSDASVSIIEANKKSIDYWVSEKDKGQSDALNKGFDASTGDVICWVNSDDIIFPGALTEVARAFRENTDLDLIMGGVAYLDQSSKITRLKTYMKPPRILSSRGIVAFGQQGLFFKKEKYLSVGKINPNLHYLMDTDLVYRFLRDDACIEASKRILGGFRWHDDMKSTDGSAQKLQEEKMVKKLYAPLRHQMKLARCLYVFIHIFTGRYLYDFLSFKFKKLDLFNNIYSG